MPFEHIELQEPEFLNGASTMKYSDQQDVFYTDDDAYRIMRDGINIYDIFRETDDKTAYMYECTVSGDSPEDALDNYYIRSLVQEMENDNAC